MYIQELIKFATHYSTRDLQRRLKPVKARGQIFNYLN